MNMSNIETLLQLAERAAIRKLHPKREIWLHSHGPNFGNEMRIRPGKENSIQFTYIGEVGKETYTCHISDIEWLEEKINKVIAESGVNLEDWVIQKGPYDVMPEFEPLD